jgi:ABC-2 type transport system ATP-binding protein
MDQKLKNYSSGMQVRLAFSIAIRAKSDILLIDEVLAVGDENFQKKCFDYFKELKKSKQTVVLVSHDMATVEEYCDRAMLINNGEVIEIGETRKVAGRYKLLNLPKDKTKDEDASKLVGDATIDKVTINGESELLVGGNDNLSIEVTYTPKVEQNYKVGISIFRGDGSHVAYYGNDKISKGKIFPAGKKQKTICQFSTKQFLSASYVVDVEVYGGDLYSASKSNAVSFAVSEDSPDKAGLININGSWEIE